MDYNQNNVDKVDKVIKTVWKYTLKGAKKNRYTHRCG